MSLFEVDIYIIDNKYYLTSIYFNNYDSELLYYYYLLIILIVYLLNIKSENGFNLLVIY